MKSIAASGVLGTIGKHLPNTIIPTFVDLSKEFKLENFVLNEKIKAFIHLAAVVGKSSVNLNLNRSRKINVIGTRDLALQIRDESDAKFIYISTSHVYKTSLFSVTESSDLGPRDEYASQKVEAELELKHIFSTSPERLSILRVFSLLDFNMPLNSLGGALTKLEMNSPSFKISNALDIRDFLKPAQVARIIYEFAHLDHVSGVFNVCTGIPNSVFDAVKSLIWGNQKLNNPENYFIFENSDVPYIVGDNTKILNYLPTKLFKSEF